MKFNFKIQHNIKIFQDQFLHLALKFKRSHNWLMHRMSQNLKHLFFKLQIEQFYFP